MKHNFLIGLCKGITLSPSYAIIYAAGGLAVGGTWVAALIAGATMLVLCPFVHAIGNVIFPDK
jgi:hypothetical protein